MTTHTKKLAVTSPTPRLARAASWLLLGLAALGVQATALLHSHPAQASMLRIPAIQVPQRPTRPNPSAMPPIHFQRNIEVTLTCSGPNHAQARFHGRELPLPVITKMSCFPYRCDRAARACASSCSAHTGCAGGMDCVSGECVMPRTYCSGNVSMNTRGARGDCGPYACGVVTGLCKTQCSQSSECASGYICDTMIKSCIAVPR